MNKNRAICVISFSKEIPSQISLQNLLILLTKLSKNVFLVSVSSLSRFNLKKLGIEAQVVNVQHKTSINIVTRIVNQIITQLKVLLRIIILCGKSSLFIFYFGGYGLIIPLLFLKILRKKTLLIPPCSVGKIYLIQEDSLFRLATLSEKVVFSLIGKVVVCSNSLIRNLNLEKHKHKVIIVRTKYVNFAKFKREKKIVNRPIYVGYIGRLSMEKGVINFVEAIPLILSKKPNVCFTICGRGNLVNTIRDIVDSKGIKPNTRLLGWISHEKVPMLLNSLRLLVLPSYTEELPKIVLEAMACGTPVLATSVGGIPDIIRDGETGFLLKSNNPKHIAEKIVELLNKPELLEKVSINAYKFVKENFNYEKTLEDWQRIINELY